MIKVLTLRTCGEKHISYRIQVEPIIALRRECIRASSLYRQWPSRISHQRHQTEEPDGIALQGLSGTFIFDNMMLDIFPIYARVQSMLTGLKSKSDIASLESRLVSSRLLFSRLLRFKVPGNIYCQWSFLEEIESQQYYLVLTMIDPNDE